MQPGRYRISNALVRVRSEPARVNCDGAQPAVVVGKPCDMESRCSGQVGHRRMLSGCKMVVSVYVSGKDK